VKDVKKPSSAPRVPRQVARCPLSQVAIGTLVRIKELSAGHEMCQRLREMGLCEEQQVKLLYKQKNVICQVCNLRLGLSHQLAETIIVEPLSLPALSAA
jgi:ferrous iron transport protein A